MKKQSRGLIRTLSEDQGKDRHVEAFLRSECERTIRTLHTFTVVYDAYLDWCRRVETIRTLSKPEFSRRLKKAGHQVYPSTRNVRVVNALRLKAVEVPWD